LFSENSSELGVTPRSNSSVEGLIPFGPKNQHSQFDFHGIDAGFTNDPIGKTGRQGVNEDQFNSLGFNATVVPEHQLLNPGGSRGYVNAQLEKSSSNGVIFNRRIGEFEYKKGHNFTPGPRIYDERFTDSRLKKAEKIREERRKSRDIEGVASDALGLAPSQTGINLEDIGINPSSSQGATRNFRTERANQIKLLRAKGNSRASIHDLLNGDLTDAKVPASSAEEREAFINKNRKRNIFDKTSDFGKKIGGKIQKLGIAGVVASGFAPSLIENITGGVENPNASFGRAGAKIGSAIGGGISGAATGAVIGSSLGPVGTAIGGAGGAIFGFVSSLKDAEERIKDIEIDKDLQKFGKALEDVISGKSDLTPTRVKEINQGFKGIETDAKGKTTASADIKDVLIRLNPFSSRDDKRAALGRTNAAIDASFSKNQREGLLPQLPQLQAAAETTVSKIKLNPKSFSTTGDDGKPLSETDILSRKSSRFQAISNSGVAPIANKIAEARQISVKEVFDELDKVAQAANKDRIAFENNAGLLHRKRSISRGLRGLDRLLTPRRIPSKN
jgi:hypothetical protein